MIRHIVLFSIKPEYKKDIPALVEGFYQMVGKIDGCSAWRRERTFCTASALTTSPW